MINEIYSNYGINLNEISNDYFDHKVLKELGSGQFGKVYEILGKDMILKVVLTPEINDREYQYPKMLEEKPGYVKVHECIRLTMKNNGFQQMFQPMPMFGMMPQPNIYAYIEQKLKFNLYQPP